MLLLAFWKVAGVSVFGTKLFATLLAAAAVVVTGLAAHRESGPVAGGGAALMLAFAPPFFFHGTTLVPETVITLIGALLLLSGSGRVSVLGPLVAALFKPTGAALAVLPALNVLCERRDRGALLRIGLALTLPVIALAGWWSIPWLMSETSVRISTSGRVEDSEFYHAFVRIQRPAEIWVFLVMRSLQFFVFDYRWLLTIGAVMATITLWIRDRRRIFVGLAPALILILSYVVIHAIMGKYPLIRYLLPAFPAFFMAGAVLVDRAFGRLAAGIVFMMCAAMFLHAHGQTSFYGAGNYRGMGSWDDHEHGRDVVRAYASAFRLAESECPNFTLVGSYPANAMAIEPELGYVRSPHVQELANVEDPPILSGRPTVILLGDHFFPLPEWASEVAYRKKWTVHSGRTSVFVGIPEGSICASR